MIRVESIKKWADAHHPKWLDVLRIILGIILFTKGIFFINDREIIISMLKGSQLEFISIIVAHYVILAHLFGGFTITIGLFTRISVAFQIPILIGAIIFVDLPRAFSSFNSDLEAAILILFLLMFFFFYGSGPLSIDNYLSKQKD